MGEDTHDGSHASPLRSSMRNALQAALSMERTEHPPYLP